MDVFCRQPAPAVPASFPAPPEAPSTEHNGHEYGYGHASGWPGRRRSRGHERGDGDARRSSSSSGSDAKGGWPDGRQRPDARRAEEMAALAVAVAGALTAAPAPAAAATPQHPPLADAQQQRRLGPAALQQLRIVLALARVHARRPPPSRVCLCLWLCRCLCLFRLRPAPPLDRVHHIHHLLFLLLSSFSRPPRCPPPDPSRLLLLRSKRPRSLRHGLHGHRRRYLSLAAGTVLVAPAVCLHVDAQQRKCRSHFLQTVRISSPPPCARQQTRIPPSAFSFSLP